MLQDDGRYRKLRKSHDEPGVAHELTFSCYRRLPLLAKDRSRQWFVDALRSARSKQSFGIWAYVIMPEHAHVLIYPTGTGYGIAKILQSIKQPVARNAIDWLDTMRDPFLARLKIDGNDPNSKHHFWQPGGGYDRDMIKARTAWLSVDYLHMNPVRRKLVQKIRNWEWSSARWYDGEKDVKLSMDGVPPRPDPT